MCFPQDTKHREVTAPWETLHKANPLAQPSWSCIFRHLLTTALATKKHQPQTLLWNHALDLYFNSSCMGGTWALHVQVVWCSSWNLTSYAQRPQGQAQSRVTQHQIVSFEGLLKEKKIRKKRNSEVFRASPTEFASNTLFLNTTCMKAPPETSLVPYNNIHQGILLMRGLNSFLFNTPHPSALRAQSDNSTGEAAAQRGDRSAPFCSHVEQKGQRVTPRREHLKTGPTCRCCPTQSHVFCQMVSSKGTEEKKPESLLQFIFN